MMVVKVEIWPNGRSDAAFEIARMEITNVSALADVSNYSVRIMQAPATPLGVPSFDINTTVASHPRRNGPWALVAKVLDQLPHVGRRRGGKQSDG